MTKMISYGLFAAVGATLTLGCSSMKRETDKALSTPSAESKTAARAAGASEVVEVNFDQGSFVLTEGSREALRDMVNDAKKNGQIDDLKILAWADKDYPTNSNTKATRADKQLADQRATAISNFVKSELKVGDVDTYNMTERPNALEDLLNTSDADVKRAFEQAGVTGSGGKSITGKASRAVVMATLED